jgi:hypothetical protein
MAPWDWDTWSSPVPITLIAIGHLVATTGVLVVVWSTGRSRPPAISPIGHGQDQPI